MKFDATVNIKAPRDKVCEFVTDAEAVSKCAPGLDSMEIVTPENAEVRRFSPEAVIGESDPVPIIVGRRNNVLHQQDRCTANKFVLSHVV